MTACFFVTEKNHQQMTMQNTIVEHTTKRFLLFNNLIANQKYVLLLLANNKHFS